MNKERIWTLLSRKLANEATQSELNELEDLLKNDPEISNEVCFVNEYWTLPTEENNEFLEATYGLLMEKLNRNGFTLNTTTVEDGAFQLGKAPKSKSTKFIYPILASLFICGIVISALFYNDFKGHQLSDKNVKSEIVTKNGSRTKIQLPDGSTVTLNSSSKLTYSNENFGTSKREVFLTGEAYFDVTKNPSAPFIVHTNNMDVKVLGTAFNVKCYPGERTTETSLIHGSVEVMIKDRNEKLMLKPNEKLVINNNNDISEDDPNSTALAYGKSTPKPIIEISQLSVFPNTRTIVETSWVENKLTFKNEKLEEIAAKMERWYNVTIIIKNKKLKNEILTGTFEKETIHQAIKALQVTSSFNYAVSNDTIILN
jgi:transmembrane sensor